MDFVAQTGINIAQAVLISGVTNTSSDNEILDILRTHGSLKTVLSVSDPKSTFYKNLIVEFEEASSFSAISSLLPYRYKSESAANRVYCVTALKDEYAATAGSSSHIPDYIHSFKEMAEKSGTSFEHILKTVMDQIHQHLKTQGAIETGNGEDAEPEETKMTGLTTAPAALEVQAPLVAPQPSQPSPLSTSTEQLGARPRQSHQVDPIHTGSTQRFSLNPNDLNPPEIQRVVVEHVVRNTDLTAPVSLRLRSFSGRVPKPSNEADYESWRSQIELLLADPSLSALHVTRRIMESLLVPAADFIKGLGPNTLPAVLLRHLDSAFGTVQDGEELYAQFLNILQNPGETASSYLQRLQLMLTTVWKRGVTANDMDRQLLKQFVRGCWNNDIITKLQLEQRRGNPPPFSELLLLLRTEEDRQQAKELLMKKYIGSSSSKQKVTIQSQSTL
ncbi:uncharacterized protein LOC119779585 [Cyprinodon tularosa]|uniref:uncharacterized protein LOC119779585 n=1 Tax=Cyprinodon tularosa TaxID=77115 RepID=UPI0018E1EC18|nr:uncharacterized protein LOC119779585 [Cyprinodon tularosa]